MIWVWWFHILSDLLTLFRKWIGTRGRTIQSWTSTREHSVSWPVGCVLLHTPTHTHTYLEMFSSVGCISILNILSAAGWTGSVPSFPAGQLSVQNNESLCPHLHCVGLCCKLNLLMRTLHKLNMLHNPKGALTAVLLHQFYSMPDNAVQKNRIWAVNSKNTYTPELSFIQKILIGLNATFKGIKWHETLEGQALSF